MWAFLFSRTRSKLFLEGALRSEPLLGNGKRNGRRISPARTYLTKFEGLLTLATRHFCDLSRACSAKTLVQGNPMNARGPSDSEARPKFHRGFEVAGWDRWKEPSYVFSAAGGLRYFTSRTSLPFSP